MLRWALFALGIAAVVWLVVDAGPEAVWATMLGAGPWLPLVIGFEIGFFAMDIVALRSIYGARARAVPGYEWVRSGMMAYGVTVLLPAGRAGGEVVRAATLARYLGAARAAAGATLLQSATLGANTLISVPCVLAVVAAAGFSSKLAWLVAGNAGVTAALGLALLFGIRYSGVGGWLGRRVGALAAHGAHFDRSLREAPLPWWALAATTFGRALQTIQYGVILLAVGAGSITVSSALIGQAIHLVGAGLGDMVPNQVGVTEMMYRIFASELGLAGQVQRAIGVALVHRICQFFLAGVCLSAGALLWPRAQTAAQAAEG